MNPLTGRLPDGWGEAPLRQLCDVQAGPSGATRRAGQVAAGGVPLVRPADVRKHRISGADLVQVDRTTAREMARYQLRGGDIVCTRTGTVGRCALITEDQDGWLFNTHLLRLRPYDTAQSAYLIGYLSMPGVARWIDQHTSGTAIRSITARALGELPVSLPPPRVQRDIGATLAALDDKIRIHEEISRTTGELRTVLADLLMTGEVCAPPTDT